MKYAVTCLAGLLAAGAVATTAIGGSHADKAIEAAVKARKAQMTLYSFNLSLLGGMAKGDIEYNADAASAAAASLAALTTIDQSRMWPPGSDSASLGDSTRAKPAIWESGSKAGEIGMALAAAAENMSMVAGDGLESLQGAIGAVGKECGACHDDYREPQE